VTYKTWWLNETTSNLLVENQWRWQMLEAKLQEEVIALGENGWSNFFFNRTEHLSIMKCIIQTLDSHLLEDTSSVSPTIKYRWYGRDEMTFYAIVQYSPSCVCVTAVGAACSRSGAAVPAGSVDASEGGIRVAKNCAAMRNWTQDLGSNTMLEDTSSVSPTIKPRWYRRGEGTSYTIVQQHHIKT
jgi:hypothetical protein